ncbi:hypothetical protein D3C73_1136810 [compost metagenome]
MLHGFKHLARLDEITRRKNLDREAAVGDLGHIARNVFGAREQRGRFIRKTGCQPPRDRRRLLCEGRCGDRGGPRGAQGGLLQKRAALHGEIPPDKRD